MFEPIIVEHLLDPDQRTVRVPIRLNELRRLVPQCQSVSTGLFSLPTITDDWQWYLKIYPNGQHRTAGEVIVYLILANAGQQSSECLKRRLHINVEMQYQNRSSNSDAETSNIEKLFDWNTKSDRWVRQAFALSDLSSVTETVEMEVQITSDELDLANSIQANHIVDAVMEHDQNRLLALRSTADFQSEHPASIDDVVGSTDQADNSNNNRASNDEMQQETKRMIGSGDREDGSVGVIIADSFFWSNARQLGLNILRKMLSLF